MAVVAKYDNTAMALHSDSRRLTLGALMSILVLTLILTACGDDGDGGGAPRPTGADANDPVLLEGRQVWVANCARCHGSDGGGGIGPKLADGIVVDRYPRMEDQVDIVRSGRGAMPAWEGQLSPQQIEAVVRYTREVL